MKVKILSSKLIIPSSSTPPHLQNLKISSFDQLSPSVYVPLIFYYPASEEEHGVNNVERSEQLQKSLSEILTLFYPLSGRYIKDNLLIDCNDKGVEYLEAQVSGCLSEFLRGGELERGLQNQLVPYLFQPDNSPMVIVQFNMFECGGLAIGICISHRIADGFTFVTFINSWSVSCRLGINEVQCTPSFHLASLSPPRDISAIKTLALRRVGDEKIVMKRFVFDGTAISKLKIIANDSPSGTSKLLKHQPTRVEVVTALVWKTLLKVSQIRHGCLRPSLMTLTVNMRGRLILPLPENSCGNFAGMAIAQFVPDDGSKLHLNDLVSQVHDAIRSTVTNYAKASNGDDLFFMLTNALREMSEAFNKSEVDVYNFTSWCRFPIYEADFGWGKPAWVNSVCAQMENIGWLMDTKDGDGVEAWVALDENSMLLFEQDLDIRAFTATNDF